MVKQEQHDALSTASGSTERKSGREFCPFNRKGDVLWDSPKGKRKEGLGKQQATLEYLGNAHSSMLLIWSGIVPLLTCHLPQCPVVRNDRWVSCTGPLLSETMRNRDEEATSDEQGFPTQATAACWKAWQPRQSPDHDPQWCHPPSRQRLRMDIHRLSRYITRNCPSPGYVISPVPHVWNKLANSDDCNGHFAHKTFAPLYQSSHSENLWKSVQMGNSEWWEFKVYECQNDSTEINIRLTATKWHVRQPAMWALTHTGTMSGLSLQSPIGALYTPT